MERLSHTVLSVSRVCYDPSIFFSSRFCRHLNLDKVTKRLCQSHLKMIENKTTKKKRKKNKKGKTRFCFAFHFGLSVNLPTSALRWWEAFLNCDWNLISNSMAFVCRLNGGLKWRVVMAGWNGVLLIRVLNLPPSPPSFHYLLRQLAFAFETATTSSCEPLWNHH